MKNPISRVNGQSACASCGKTLATGKNSWKKVSNLKSEKAKEVVGMSKSVNDKLILRHFHCPECDALLETEVVLEGDPILEDFFIES